MSDYVYINASFCFNIVFKHIVQLVDFFFKEISHNMCQMQKEFECLKADKYTDQWRCIQAVLGWRNRGRGQGVLSYFDRSVNPTSTGGADYAHDITTCPTDFQIFFSPYSASIFKSCSSKICIGLLCNAHFKPNVQKQKLLNSSCLKIEST